MRRDRVLDPFLPKIEEWVERARGKVRADGCYDKLVALGSTGRTARSAAVAEAQKA